METGKPLNHVEQCRICQSCETGQLLIFGVSGAERVISEKIHECLPIKVSEKDGLPNTVCNKCSRKLEEFCRFRQQAVETAQTLQDLLPDKSDSDTSSKTTITSSEDKTKDLKPMGVDIVAVSSGGSSNSNPGSVSGSVSGKALKSKYPPLADPHPDDYVLMKEETINVDNSSKNSNIMADYLIEFNNNNRVKVGELEDLDIVNAMRKRREILPPMWDVFERVQSDHERQITDQQHNSKSIPSKGSKQALRNVLKGKFSVIHRRYIIAKGAFPCSLCGRCFRFNQGVKKEGAAPLQQLMADMEEEEGDEEDEGEETAEEGGGEGSGPASPAPSAPAQTAALAQLNDTSSRSPHLCTICNKTFSRNEHLTRHLNIHFSPKTFQCDLCPKTFTRKEHLNRHRSSTHAVGDEDSTDDKPHPCDICHTVFMRREYLTKHRKEVHGLDAETDNGPKPFTCSYCFKSFTRKEHLTRHRKIHLRAANAGGGDSKILIPTTVSGTKMATKQQVKPLSISKDTVTLEISAGASATSDTTDIMSSILEKGKYGEVSIERRRIPAEQVVTPAMTDDVDDDDAIVADSAGYYTPDGLTEEQRAQLEGFLGAGSFDTELLSAYDNERRQNIDPDDYIEDKDSIDLEDLKRMPKCRICSKAFTKKSHLHRHLKRYHNLSKEQIGLGKFEMYENGGIYDQGEGKEEMDELHDEEGGPVLKKPRCNWSCNICHKTFTRKYHMYRHQKTQHGIQFPTREQQKEEVKCGGCSAMFPTQEDLSAHECTGANAADDVTSAEGNLAPANDSSPRRKPFKCAICKSSFNSHDGFKDHECKKNKQ